MNRYTLVSTLFILIGICFVVSCEKSTSNSIDADVITVQHQIVRINSNRTSLELDNEYTLDLGNAALSRTRPSCSGFEACTAGDIGIDDYAEYSYTDDTAGVDYSHRTVRPFKVRFWRVECVDTASAVQWLLDSDLDNYPDVIDAFPEDPTKH